MDNSFDLTIDNLIKLIDMYRSLLNITEDAKMNLIKY